MPMIPVQNAGSVGVIKDLSTHEMPLGAWTDASNVRFLDGYAGQFLGHGDAFSDPSAAPQYTMPVAVASTRYWIYATQAKCYAVTNTAGVSTHTDITHATPRAGAVNAWTGCVFGGIPILNTGDTSAVPMFWDQNLAHKFVDLLNWPAATYCRSLRSFKNFLIALGVTKSGTSYPFMVKWSSLADAGALPSTWDPSDATKEAGEYDLAESQDQIIDGLQLRDSFMVYKESSIWRMDFVGGVYVFRFSKVLGTTGAMNRNCIVEIDGFHVVLTGSDVIVHDGQSPTSILDKQSRRFLFQNIDISGRNLCFLFKNPFLNEVFICYPSFGATACDRAMVWNYVDRTVSFRTLPNLNHANFGAINNTLGGSWQQDNDPWSADLTAWQGPDFTPDAVRVIMASANTKLHLLDSSATFGGQTPVAYLERRGLALGDDSRIKLVKSIRPRITGNNGDTVIVRVGSSNSDPYADPTYGPAMTHVIGSTISDDCFVSGRYIAVRIESGTALQWRLDSYDIEVEQEGLW
jgi:hypothetical protein